MGRLTSCRWTPLDFVDRLERRGQTSVNAICLHTNGGGSSLVGWFNGEYARTGQRIGSTVQVYGDGRADQLADTDSIIYASYGLSRRAIDIETQDDGDPSRPWTHAQVLKIVQVIREAASHHPIPLRLMMNENDGGITWHERFRVFNQSGHSCPGSVREQQIVNTIIPMLSHSHPVPHPAPAPNTHAHYPAPRGHLPLPVGVYDVDTATWQQQMVIRGWHGLAVDGHFGPASQQRAKVFQQQKGLTADGIVGPATWAATWTAPL